MIFRWSKNSVSEQKNQIFDKISTSDRSETLEKRFSGRKYLLDGKRNQFGYVCDREIAKNHEFFDEGQGLENLRFSAKQPIIGEISSLNRSETLTNGFYGRKYLLEGQRNQFRYVFVIEIAKIMILIRGAMYWKFASDSKKNNNFSTKYRA